MINEDAVVLAGQYSSLYEKAIKIMAREMDYEGGVLPSIDDEYFKSAVAFLLGKNSLELRSRSIGNPYHALTEKDFNGGLLNEVVLLLMATEIEERERLSKSIAARLVCNATLFYREDIEKEVMSQYEKSYAKESIEDVIRERQYVESHR